MKKHDRTKRPPNTKLTEDLVRALRADRAAGLSQKERAAREEAEQLAVWAVRHSAGLGLPEEGLEYWHDGDNPYSVRAIKFDGTDAGIRAALRRAKEGSE